MNREGTEGIGYLDFTWGPVVGCTHGCPWCWARRQAKRQKHRCQKCYDFTPHLHPERLDEPLRRKKPSVIGACFMGDLFDPTLPDQGVWDVLGRMEMAERHTFVVLTKRPQRASHFAFSPNVVLGVSVEDQASADRLIPELLDCLAATRIVSIEPTLGPVDLRSRGFLYGRDDMGNCPVCAMPNRCRCEPQFPHLDGVILGGQTGPGAAPMRPDWVRKVRDQCAEAGVPFYFKGWGDVILEEAMSEEVFADADAGGWLREYGNETRYRIGRKRAGRILDDLTHDETAWGNAEPGTKGIKK